MFRFLFVAFSNEKRRANPIGPPSYAETLEFINAKLRPLMNIGFGEKTGRMIFWINYFNSDGDSASFDPRDLNAEVRYEKWTVNMYPQGCWRNWLEAPSISSRLWLERTFQ